ncbi:hypothetical protein TNIN_68381 [Trichonephila inaurata madagascariensis]|uniref:C2H2-type domain-containing protein n=1 Tax=Trichonephila inaurata madagascariensis TaxID=2747483 RepID=A0A8X6X7E6_9ARAC|nr:hypothetical protein TNIN_68381 [Trichonephila inaurata madagascariensis]
MAEGSILPIEEDCFYFCLTCKRKMHEKDTDYSIILSLELSYICSSCGERFESGYSGKKRKSIQTGTYLCEVCGEMFHKSSALLYHSYRHSGE